MKKTLEEKIQSASNLLDVLLIFKDAIFKDLHVATLAYVDKEILPHNGKYGIVQCKPFPLNEGQEPYSIQAYYFDENNKENFNENDIVIILYMDNNFISSLANNNYLIAPTNDLIKHNIKYGVIIKSM